MSAVMSSNIEKAAIPKAVEGAIKRILVVDDSRAQRRLLSTMLKRWGFSVLEAGSGDEALEILQTHSADLILSDWMMPGMSGVEFCQIFRQLDKKKYGYFILLTSKSEKEEVAHGLEVGADDFLTKPVSSNELRARITAAERILSMERELIEKNALVSRTLEEISALYDTLDRDLIEAKKLQQSLVKERYRSFETAQISLLLRPSGHVGGDLVGMFPISDTEIGIYAIDVSGHGITSALMTARLAGYLSGASPKQNVALEKNGKGGFAARPPAVATELLNRLCLEEMDTEHYFTLVLAILNLVTGEVVLTQAGHPHPAIQRADGTIEYVGNGGMPVGLIEGATYEECRATLLQGDRLLILSDGITECPNALDVMLEEEGLEALLWRNRHVQGPAMLEALVWDLQEYAGEKEFPDDVSAAMVEFGPPPPVSLNDQDD
ncbi:PP2C family protein-serine/threonine phosphatase [Falsihalocynthiibacter arcticus]|nr:fused response regulator/phosphatase [Falsihalocynthiibacter arcticus]